MKAQVNFDSLGGGGRETKVMTGHISSGVSATITTVDDVTGEAFEPKIIYVDCIYSNSSRMVCVYNKERSTTTYSRILGTTLTTLPIPRTNDYAGLDTVSSTGFTLWRNSDFTDFYFIAEG